MKVIRIRLLDYHIAEMSNMKTKFSGTSKHAIFSAYNKDQGS